MKLSDLIIPAWAKFAAAAVVAAVVAAGIAWSAASVQKAFDDRALSAYRIEAAQAQTAAVAAALATERAQVALTQKNSAAAAAANAQIKVEYRDRIKEVTRYVSVQADAVGCIPWGAVRVLDAAAQRIRPESLSAPAGQSDDACSDLAPSAFTAAVLENYGIAYENADQLDRLIGDIRERVELFNAAP